MNPQTHSTRVVSIVSKSFHIFFAAVLLTFLAGAASAQTFYTDWTATANPLVVNFTLPDGTTGTITKTNTACAGFGNDSMPVVSLAHGSSANYPSNFFTPTPPDPLEFVSNGINRDGGLPGCASPTAVANNYVIDFSETVANIRFHYINLDSGTYRFFDLGMSPINLTRLSGNADFEVSGNAVNSTPLDATAAGCDTVPNTSHAGGCGSIFVPGKYTQLRLTATDVTPSASGDGHAFTMSINADHGDAPASYDNFGVGEASHDLLAFNLRLGSSVDADTAEKSGLAATGDDTTGSDDEDGAVGLAPYLPAGGQTCIGTFGTYTTQPNEYCTRIATQTGGTAAQLVGWLDADGDGDFLDANDRSVPLNNPAVDDGTFATPNTTLGSAVAILVWQGLPSTLPPTRYFRFRITRDASFLVDPQPTGAAIDGEVEDYAIFEPTAANVSISGRVMTAAGRGLPRTTVILTDMNGSSRTATTSMFGYFRFDDVQVGETYILTAVSKGYQFQQQTISVLDEMSDLDFIALE